VTQKAANDYVSEVDREAEAAIIRVISETYPGHSILAEESGASGNSEYVWIIDPLDGTTNFLHGFPHYAVSIALSHKGVLSQAVIYDPVRNELFTASRGRGAYLNDHRMRVGKRSKLQGCLLGTGFPFKEFSVIDTYLAMFKDLAQKTSGIRRAGAATLDLAYVAAGRLDGFWEFGLAPWDMAAGSLLITEAGGLVGDFRGNNTHLETGNIVGGNPKLFSQLIQSLAPYLNDRPKQ
jgi:myo-inositol-1(or 4)-monophosphatase